MFLDFLDTEEGRKITKLARESSTFNKMYEYWRDSLFERIMRLFVWDTGKEKDAFGVKNNLYIPPKEIEQRLLLAGHCGITMFNNELTAMYGTMYGVTKYQDEWSHYTVRCPIYAGMRTIGKDVVVADNNALRNPAFPLVHHYSIMLAHTEVSIILALVNIRSNNGIPVVSTEKQKQSVAEYQGRIFNGQYGTVTDVGNLGIEFAGAIRQDQSIMELYEIREKLVKSFYSDIGVRSAFEKRNNTVMAEVEADTSLLLLNLSDMIDSRERTCERVNDMFGTNWSVHVAEEIDYGAENERMQFDTSTNVHISTDYQTDDVDNKGGELNE